MSVMVETGCLKLRGDAKDLADALGVVTAVVPAKSTRPILQNVLLDACAGVLELTGTDLDVSIRVRVERVDVLGEGRVLVNAARFQQILRELSGDQVEVEVDDRAGCTISTGDAKFHVMGEQPDDYPELPEVAAEGGHRFPAAALAEMIRRTQFAAHPEKTRYAMNGVLVDLADRRLRLVATDGKRLAMQERVLAEDVPTPVFVVVPTKAMALLQRIAGATEGDVELFVEATQILLRTSGTSVVARLIEGHFPPYEDVLPRAHDKRLTLPREGFMAALRRAALLATKDSQAVRFQFAREGLVLTARVPEVGESRVTFPLDYPFDPIETGFNPAFFVDVLRVLEGVELTLALKDAKSAAVIEERFEGGSYVYLVMPLNLTA